MGRAGGSGGRLPAQFDFLLRLIKDIVAIFGALEESGAQRSRSRCMRRVLGQDAGIKPILLVLQGCKDSAVATRGFGTPAPAAPAAGLSKVECWQPRRRCALALARCR
jgi:hypothetical protein